MVCGSPVQHLPTYAKALGCSPSTGESRTLSAKSLAVVMPLGQSSAWLRNSYSTLLSLCLS